MNINFDQSKFDDEKQGYGSFILEREEDENFSFADTDSIAIGYPDAQGHMQYLDPDQHGWIANPKRLKLAARPVIAEDSAEFILQPAYIDQLQGATYDVVVLDSAGENKAVGRQYFEPMHSGLPGATPFLKAWDEVDEPDEKKEKPEPAKENINQPEQPLQEKTNVQAADEKKAEEPAIDAAKGDASEPPLAQEEFVTLKNPDKKGSGGMMIAAALLLAILLGGGAFYYFKYSAPAQETAQEEARKAEEAEANRKAAEEAAKAEAEKKAAAEAEAQRKAAQEAEVQRKAAAQAALPQNRVAQYFQGSTSPDTAMQLAKELKPQNSEDQDAIFKLYYYAAQNGNQEGAEKYAQCVDPSSPAWGTVQKNAAEAWQFYGETPNGQAARTKLKQWTEQQAATGNRVAREWLKEMN